ncbi:AI-2E family transporter [Algisphaera agarilytica]|uniref:Putative PurR-regulated permease PerM n=1 Tax=Algisphaera agarilytica TaxID=1385975 RepID=A0A7X0H9S5_9BACT|nr:AI-2E family transporter [Algisphaera agarilytica]MBB6431728.1 putative PurR-regulated permease PerM [Algisphaera agarilytica]
MSDSADAVEPSPQPPEARPEPARATPGKPEFRRYVWQRRWFQTLLAALVIFLVLSYVVPGVLGMLYAVRSVLVPVLIGLALAYIVNPALRFVELKMRIGRLAGTISLMLLALVMVMVIMVTAVPTMYQQGGELLKTIQEAYPRYVDKLLARIDQKEAGESEQRPDVVVVQVKPEVAANDTEAEIDGTTQAAEIDAEADAVSPEAAEEDASIVDKFINPDRNRRLLELSVERLKGLDGSVIAGWAMQSLDIGVGLVGSAVSFTSYIALSAVVIVFCFFFFSWKFDAILKWFEPFIPRSHQAETIDMLKKMDLAVSSFVRGRLIQSLVMMVILIVGWWIADVPYWFLLGVVTGLMNLVPFLPAVGWILALILAVITTLANGGDFTVALILWPSVVYFAAQSLDGWVVEPLVQGQATNLDPLTVMLVVLVGGTLAGLLGMLLAIPLAACVKILSREMLLPRLRKVAAEA